MHRIASLVLRKKFLMLWEWHMSYTASLEKKNCTPRLWMQALHSSHFILRCACPYCGWDYINIYEHVKCHEWFLLFIWMVSTDEWYDGSIDLYIHSCCILSFSASKKTNRNPDHILLCRLRYIHFLTTQILLIFLELKYRVIGNRVKLHFKKIKSIFKSSDGDF